VQHPERFVPALRFRWLTPFYDFVAALTTRESAFKQLLLQQADPKPGWRVLDLACGTGTLTLMAKQQEPAAIIIGLDGDPQILKIARGKAQKAGLDIDFRQGLSYELPFPDHSFDCVLSSLFFHHLQPDQKDKTCRELARILRPGCKLHVADWGAASGPISRALFYPIQLLDGFSNTADHAAGRLPAYFERASFEQVEVWRNLRTIHGNLSLLSGCAPADPIAADG